MMSLLRRKKGNGDESKPKTRRPPNTAFRQQRLKAWQPLLSPKSVLPLLVAIAVVFVPIGVGLLLAALGVQSIDIDYSRCAALATDTPSDIPAKYVTQHFKHKTSQPQWELQDNTCRIHFSVPQDIKPPLYVYYKLTNFYQNHRKYVQSFDFDQLRGKAVAEGDLSSDCKPLKSLDNKPIYPCGLIANSMFNDTFSSVWDGGDVQYNLTNKGISWKADRHRFKQSKYSPSDVVPPPNWAQRFPDGYTEENFPNLHEWEELQVWMRTAGLPKFYKLALKNEHNKLHAGNYSLDIGLNYPVEIFGGTKSIVITTSSIIGGRNMYLGSVYIIVGAVAGVFAIIFLFKLMVQPRKMGDHSYLNFEDDQDIPLREVL